jgi:MscS family membrane protein
MKRLMLWWLCLGLGTGILLAQNEAAADTSVATPPPPPPSYDEPDAPPSYSQRTPREAAGRHLYYLMPDTYQPEKAAEVIAGDQLTLDQRIDLAIQLRDLFDATGSYVNLEKIPDQAAYLDSTTGQAQYVIFPKSFPDVYLARYGDQWYYSRSTVARIPQIYQQRFPLGADLLQQLVPVIGQRAFLGLPVWKWLGLLILVALAYLIYRLIDFGLGWIIRQLVPKIAPGGYLDPALVPPVSHPLGLLLIFWIGRDYLMTMLLLPIGISDPLRRILSVAMSIAGVIVFYKLVDIIASVFRSLANLTESTMDDQLIPLLTRAAKLAIIVFGLLFTLDNLDVDVTALLAGVSIGGLAIALAAQDTVKNFIGSISIFVDRPFTVGDFIVAGDITGTVLEVGVRTTRIRALDGASVTVPNGDLSNRTITNHTLRDYRRYATSITVTYRTKPQAIEEFVRGVRALVNAHPKVREGSATVQFHEMSHSSLDIFYAAIFEVTDHGEWLACRQEVFLEIIKLAEQMNVSFAFPSTSVYLESMPGTKENPLDLPLG